MSDENSSPVEQDANGHTVGSLENRLGLAKGVIIDSQTGGDGALLFRIGDKLVAISLEDMATNADLFALIQKRYEYQLSK